MPKKTSILATAAVLAALAFAAPAGAHQGHASCGEGAQVFVVPLAQSGQAGKFVSAQAQAGTMNESVAAGHAALCEPKP